MLSSCPSETPVFPGPRTSLPQLRGEKAWSSGPPGAEGGSGPCWALGGAPAQPNPPGRARLQQVSPNREEARAPPGRGAAGRGAETLPGASARVRSGAHSRWLSRPFRSCGSRQKPRLGPARRGAEAFSARGGVCARDTKVFSRSQPVPGGGAPGRDRQCWMVGVAAQSGPRGHGGRAQDEDSMGPFCERRAGPLPLSPRL